MLLINPTYRNVSFKKSLTGWSFVQKTISKIDCFEEPDYKNCWFFFKILLVKSDGFEDPTCKIDYFEDAICEIDGFKGSSCTVDLMALRILH